jgi:hypothetical protein
MEVFFMFKKAIFGILFVILIVSFISCTELPEAATIPVAQRLHQAEEALNNGNAIVAENLLTQVLNADPTNPKANIGMGFINLLKANRKILTLVERLTSIATSSPRILSPFEMLLEIDFSHLQTDINSIVVNLEDSKSELETALDNMTSNITITIHPNRFDWNKDGFTDSISPLNLSFDPYGGSETRLWWVIFDSGPVSSERAIFDETKRGDAWFDIETINYIVSGSNIPVDYEPTFDETDFMTLDATGVKVLLTFVNLELSVLEPTLIWNLDPNTELTDWLTEASNTHDSYDSFLDFATTTIDLDYNGTMTNTEIRTIMPNSFMSFYSIPNGGLNAISDWASALNGFSQTGLELYSAGFFDFLPTDVEDLFINAGKLSTDSTFKIQIDSSSPTSPVRIIEPLQTFLTPYNFFNTPENFSDLKDFIPEIGYMSFIINFPDETFGGIIEKLPAIRNIIERFIG